jgi:adenosylhomocysteine nucleosidase
MKLVGIIGAMEQEVALLKQQLTNATTTKIASFEFHRGSLQGVDVVLVQSGIGKVTAAIATALLIHQFQPDCVINTGSAGGFDPELSVGDIVISSC